MTDAPDADERIQTVRCIGCDRLSLVGDCHADDHKRLQCPRCGTRVPVEAIHGYVHESVTGYYE
jgi:phage FluMu protein Com